VTENDRICLLDFDRAGIAEKDTCPLFMNYPDLAWPDGADDGTLLKIAHDQEILQPLVSHSIPYCGSL
jgi:hypothetical protein